MPESPTEVVRRIATFEWTLDFLLRRAIQEIRYLGDPLKVADKLEEGRKEAFRDVGLTPGPS